MGIQNSLIHRKRIALPEENYSKPSVDKKHNMNILDKVGSEEQISDKSKTNFDKTMTSRNKESLRNSKQPNKKPILCFQTLEKDKKGRQIKPKAEMLIRYKSILSCSTNTLLSDKDPPAKIFIETQKDKSPSSKQSIIYRTNPSESISPKVGSRSTFYPIYRTSMPQTPKPSHLPVKFSFHQSKKSICTIKSFCAFNPFISHYPKKQYDYSSSRDSLWESAILSARNQVKSPSEDMIKLREAFQNPIPNNNIKALDGNMANKKLINRHNTHNPLEHCKSMRMLLPHSIISSAHNSPKRKMKKGNAPTSKISAVFSLGNSLTSTIEEKPPNVVDLEHPPVLIPEKLPEPCTENPPIKFRTITEKTQKPICKNQSPEYTPSPNTALRHSKALIKSQTTMIFNPLI